MKNKFQISLITIGLLLLLIITIIPISDATVTFSQLTTSGIGITITRNETINRLYNYDLNTSALLDTRLFVTKKDTVADSFTYPLRLTDSKYFTGNQFYVRIYGLLGSITSANIVFLCTFINGSGSRNITITGNGIYNIGTTGFYITNCSQSQVTKVVGIGSFSYMVNQSRYGILWHPYNLTSILGYNVFAFDSGRLDIGGVTNIKTNFSLNNLQLQFFSSGKWLSVAGISPVILIRSIGNMTLENVQISSNYTSSISNYSSFIQCLSNKFHILNSSIQCYNNRILYNSATTKCYINNSIFKNIGFVIGKYYLRDVTLIGGGGGGGGIGSLNGIYGLYSCNIIESNNVYITKCMNAVKCQSYDFWLNDSTLYDNDYFCGCYLMAYTGKFYNVISDNWNLNQNSTWNGGTISRMYSYDNKFINNNIAESGVNVKIWNKTMSLKVNKTSGINGYITKSILPCENWTTNTPIWYTPYTVNMSKGRWYSNFTFNITDKINWTVPLTNIFTIMQPNITIKNPNPANGTTYFHSNYIQNDTNGLSLAIDVNFTRFSIDFLKIFYWIYINGVWYGDTLEDISHNGTYSMFFPEINISNYTYYWYTQIWSDETDSFIYTSKNYTFTTSNTTAINDDWLYIGALNLSTELLLLSIFFMLFYFWFKSENWRMSALLAMVIIPYDFVVIIIYTLPLYILDVDILAFVQIIFMIIAVIVGGYTIEDYRIIKKSKK